MLPIYRNAPSLLAHKSARRIPVHHLPDGWTDAMECPLSSATTADAGRNTVKPRSVPLAAPGAQELVDNCAVLKSCPRGHGTGLPMASLDEQTWDMLQQKQQRQ